MIGPMISWHLDSFNSKSTLFWIYLPFAFFCPMLSCPIPYFARFKFTHKISLHSRIGIHGSTFWLLCGHLELNLEIPFFREHTFSFWLCVETLQCDNVFYHISDFSCLGFSFLWFMTMDVKFPMFFLSQNLWLERASLTWI